MAKKEFGDYYLGLDIGTNSVGWAVTDPQYNILRFNGKAMWGIHLFKEGKTAADRRVYRCARRRLQRRKQRIELLQDLMDSEVSSVDPGFFERLKESNLQVKDRRINQTNSIFNDPAFKDKDYHERFPTIYHLRWYLMTTGEKPDIRLVYLAIHHILKSRGHFLFEGLSDGEIPDFEPVFKELMEKSSSELGLDFEVHENIGVIKSLLIDKDIRIPEKKKRLYELLSADSKQQKAFADLLSGAKVDLSILFFESESEDAETLPKVSFGDASFEENISSLENVLDEGQMNTLLLMKTIYDWGVLSKLLDGEKYLSESMVKKYDLHRKDLSLLKTLLKDYGYNNSNDYSLYRDVFKSHSESDNYCAYSGMVKQTKDPTKIKFCNQEKFCDYLKKKLKGVDFDRCDTTKDMWRRIEDKTFMPLQRSGDNSVIPNALHRAELVRIIENMSHHYPFFNEKDEKGVTIGEKICKLCTFRIPYYIGPLSQMSEKSWAIHKGSGRVTPLNFEDKIDIDRSSEKFIEKLVSRCTYLVGETVLPKSSLLYQRFKLYNELNNIRINGERIRYDLKKDLIDQLFVKRQTPVTKKKIRDFVVSRTGDDAVEITGIDDKVASSLKLEAQLKVILGKSINDHEFVEELIRMSTIFGDDVKRLNAKIKTDYADRLTKDQIFEISRLKFRDWGNLSYKFLTGIYSTLPDGRVVNIIEALESTDQNLMELLSDKYDFRKKVDEFNASKTGKDVKGISYDIVDELYCSPAVKHSIWRTLSIIKEIVKITGHNPAKVFIETTREARDDGRKISRLDDLQKKYKEMDRSGSYQEIVSVLESLEGQPARLRSKRLFAYLNQRGRCVYCDAPIDLNDIENHNVYDIDHIIPQSIKKDDSINNTVLVCRACNMDKSDTYPIKPHIQSKMCGIWKDLLNCKLMSEEKYRRLTRVIPLSDDEKCSFIARQLVETSQSVKAVAEALKKVFDKDTDIVYVKGGNVSEFRNTYKGRGFYTKARNVNDYHHAKDAYLNIVVGNTYDVKFTKNPLHVVSKEHYHMGKMFEKDVSRNGVVAWVAGEEGTIKTVDKYIKRDNVLYTRSPYKVTGQLYDLNILKKGDGQHPIKKDLDIEDYGGYNKISGSFFSLVEHTVKKKRVRSLEAVPIMDAGAIDSHQSAKAYFENKGLIDPDVRISCIKIDSLFEFRGMSVTLSGRTGNSVVFHNAEQLILSNEMYDYCKSLYKYDEDRSKKSNYSLDSYSISKEFNSKLYSELGSKVCKLFSNAPTFGLLCNMFNGNNVSFESLDLDVQTNGLIGLLKILHCAPSSVDIKPLGGSSSQFGKIPINKVLKTEDEPHIIYQSVTGLFEKRIDLMKI